VSCSRDQQGQDLMNQREDRPGPAAEAPQAGGRRDGCFYAINTLMILFGLIPVTIGLILLFIWLFLRA
jgi:hypothetical protein